MNISKLICMLIAGLAIIGYTTTGLAVGGMNGDGANDAVIADHGLVVSLHGPAFPTPDITANGLDGLVTPIDNLSVTIELEPGLRLGDNADWWVAAETPLGWFYFDVSARGWIFAGTSPTDLLVTHQGLLFELHEPFEVLNIPVSALPAGTYAFYFAVDMNMNGLLDFDLFIWFSDVVVVNITP